MDLDDRLVIKVRLGEEVRKMPIHNEEMTYDELIIMMERVFKHKLTTGDEIVVKYSDEDNDLITITDDSDLAFAMESGKVLKLVLSVQNEEEITKNEGKELNDLDLKNIRKELQVIRDHTNKLLDKIVHFSNGTNLNPNDSGRTSTTGVGDYHAVGGKEFDPLSVGNQITHNNSAERTESAASFGSNMRQDDNSGKDSRIESNDAYRPSATITKNQNMTQSITSSNPISHMNPSNIQQSVTGAFNLPPSATGHLSQSNMLPQNIGGQNMPPQNIRGQNMSQHNMPPQGMGGQNIPPQNMGGQVMPTQNMGGQNMPPQHMGGQNVPPQHMSMANMPPTSINAMNLTSIGGPNMPPSSFTGYNVSGQNDPSAPKMPGYMSQSRPTFYPPGSLPPQGQPRPGSNFSPVPPNISGTPIANGQQTRPNMPPQMGGQTYFNPNQQTGGQMYNPQIPQSSPYGGYQPNK